MSSSLVENELWKVKTISSISYYFKCSLLWTFCIYAQGIKKINILLSKWVFKDLFTLIFHWVFSADLLTISVKHAISLPVLIASICCHTSMFSCLCLVLLTVCFLHSAFLRDLKIEGCEKCSVILPFTCDKLFCMFLFAKLFLSAWCSYLVYTYSWRIILM